MVYGLTVGIDADASKFNKEIKKMDRNIVSTKKEVSELSKSLNIKWDSKVFVQAQKSAQDALNQTELKVKSLKDRLKYLDDTKTDKTSAEYRKLQSEIIKTESQVVVLKKELKEINNLKFTQLGASLKSVGQQLTSVGQSMTRNLTLPIIAAGTAAVKFGLDLDTALRKVSTLFGSTEVNVEMLRNKIQELAIATGMSATELSEGLYQALSAGVPVTEDMSQAISFLTASTSLAKAGFTTTEKAVDALTTVINAYGYAQEDVGKISDIFLATQNKGKTTVDQLANSIAKVIPTAAALGVSFEDISASLAGMTIQGVRTEQATTSLNALLVELGKTGTNASNILKNQTGKSLQELMASGMGLNDVFGILLNGAEDTDTALIDLFGSIEAAKAFLGLTANEGKIFADSLDAINNSSGATASALERVNGPANQLRVSFQKLKTALEDVGAIIIPIVVGIVDKIGGMIDKFNALDETVKTTVIRIAGIVAAIGPLLLIFGKLTSGIGSLISIIPKLSGVLTVLMAHPIIALVGVIIGLLAYLYTSNEQFRESINSLVSDLSSSLQPVLEEFINVFKTILNAIMPVINLLGNILAPIILLLGKILGPLLQLILMPLVFYFKQLGLVIQKITEWIAPLIAIIKDKLIVIFDKLKVTVDKVFTFIKETIAKIPQFFEDVLNGVIDFINKAIDQINKLGDVLGFTIGKLDNVAFKSEVMQDVTVTPTIGEIPDTNLTGGNIVTPTPSIEQVLGDLNLDSQPQTVITNDYSDKTINFELVIQNYGEELDYEEIKNRMNIMLAGDM